MIRYLFLRFALYIGLIFSLVTVYSFISKVGELSHSYIAQGRVVGFILRGESSYAAVSYHDPQNTPVQGAVPSWTTWGASNGAQLKLLVDERYPDKVQVYSFLVYWISTIILTLISAFCLVLGIRARPDIIEKIRSRVRGTSASSAPSPHQYDRQQREAAQPLRKKAPASSTAQASLTTDQRTFGILQPLIDDSTISDIVASNYQEVTTIKNGKVAKTNIQFPNREAYETFVDRVLYNAGVSYSVSKPIVDGMIGPNVRIHAINTVLCDQGPYLTIRVSRFPIITVQDLARSGLAPRPILRYLQGLVASGHTTLIAGEVGCGKTTLLRALASAIASDESILVIEDTPEVQIDHPHVRYIRTREANIAGFGEIQLDQCIKASMRMAMSRIILGEIRDPEAAEAFIDVCISGHPGLCTIHARSANDALNRLEVLMARRAIGAERRVLREQIATAVHLVVFLRYCKKTNQRRIFEIKEMRVGEEGTLHQQVIFQYDVFEGLPGWKVVSRESYFQESLIDRTGPISLQNLPAVFGLDT